MDGYKKGIEMNTINDTIWEHYRKYDAYSFIFNYFGNSQMMRITYGQLDAYFREKNWRSIGILQREK